MNTPAHLVVNTALLAAGPGRPYVRWIAAGALLPDLPMFGFFVWERFVEGATEAQIWGVAYFEPAWQVFFDAFNSAPLTLATLVIASVAGRAGPAWLAASGLLHQCLDLPLHREDGHRHFFPFSDWRFMSPVSYWDPEHHGALAALGEWGLLAMGSALLWRRFDARVVRAALLLTNALYAAVWVGFYARAG